MQTGPIFPRAAGKTPLGKRAIAMRRVAALLLAASLAACQPRSPERTTPVLSPGALQAPPPQRTAPALWPDAFPAPPPERTAPALWPGAFRLLESRTLADGSLRSVADASDDSRHCQFEIILKPGTDRADGLFQISTVALVRRPATDCRDFLGTLARALQYDGPLPHVTPKRRIVAPISISGEGMLRVEHEDYASFEDGPDGTWLVGKLSLTEGGGEVYFNLDRTNAIGEFSIKDEGYAEEVVSKLASILLPAK